MHLNLTNIMKKRKKFEQHKGVKKRINYYITKLEIFNIFGHSNNIIFKIN